MILAVDLTLLKGGGVLGPLGPTMGIHKSKNILCVAVLYDILFLDADLLNALLRVRSIFTRVSEFVQREIREADDEPAPVHAAEDMHAGSDASTLFLITLGYCFLHSS